MGGVGGKGQKSLSMGPSGKWVTAAMSIQALPELGPLFAGIQPDFIRAGI